MPDIRFDPEWWEKTEAQFWVWYPNFHHKLYTHYPDLTPKEIKLCLLILLKKDSNEISDIFGISIESLHTACYRLRKHLNLPHEAKLFGHLVAIAESVR